MADGSPSILYRAQNRPGVPWRCERCGAIIALIYDGRAELARPKRIILDADGALVICPICRTARRWRPAAKGLE